MVKQNEKILEKFKKKKSCSGGESLSSMGWNLPHESMNCVGFLKPFTNFHSHRALIQYALWGDRGKKLTDNRD